MGDIKMGESKRRLLSSSEDLSVANGASPKKDWIEDASKTVTKDIKIEEILKKKLPRRLSVVGDWRMLPSVCQGALSFYTSEKFYFNKWLQSDFLSILLVHGSKGDSEETIMVKAFIVTSAELAEEMQEVKTRAGRVLVESIRTFLKKRKDRKEREHERQLAIQAAIKELPVKPWKAIEIPDQHRKSRQTVARNLSVKDLWRAGAKKVIFAGNLAQGFMPKQKFRASTLVDAAAAGNAKLLEELLLSRRTVIARHNSKHPAPMVRMPSRQVLGSFARLKPVSPSDSFTDLTLLLVKEAKETKEKAVAPVETSSLKESLNLLRLEDLNIPDITRKTPLQAAVEHKSWDCMSILLNESEIDICVPDQQNGNSIIHTILTFKGVENMLEIIKMLLAPRFRFDVNMKNRKGSTLLMLAAGRPSPVTDEQESMRAPAGKKATKNSDQGVEILKYLLDKDADVTAVDSDGRYALEYAAEAANFEHVQLLAEHSETNEEAIHRALFAAIPREGKANLEIVRYLICEKHAEMQQQTGRMDNVLIVAARNNQLECLRALLSWPFIPRDLLKARNTDCYTALHAAVHEKNNGIALMLVKSIFGHSVLDEHAELGLATRKSTNRNMLPPPPSSQDAEDAPQADHLPPTRPNPRHRAGRRRALIVSTTTTDSEVMDSFLFSVAAQARNVEMIEHMLFESSSFKDATIQVNDRLSGPISTNLICWSVRQRNQRLLNLLLNFGVDINATEVNGSGLFPLMIAVKNLAAPPWSHLAMEVLQVGKDTPCIALQDIVNIVKMSKWEICHVADMLQDSKGNPLKSPTGRQLFSRNSWKFSWYGFQAVCSEISLELKVKVETYANELDVSLQIYETIMNHPSVDIQQEVVDQTACALAVECGNWKVFEDLKKRGASICHPSVIQACAVNKCVQLLISCLQQEKIELTLTEETLRKMFDRTCDAGHVECAQLLFEHGKQRNLYLSVQEQVIKAATDKQHWMIDFLLSKDRSYNTKGKALLICAENGDFRSLAKLLAHGADPNYSHEEAEQGDTAKEEVDADADGPRQRRPISIAGEYWGRSGSHDHFEVVVHLLHASLDVNQPDGQGKTILMWAALRGHVMLAEAVLAALCRDGHKVKPPEARAFINLQDSDGRTALMHAVLSSSADCVDLLLLWDADVDIMSYPGADGSMPLTALGYLTSICCERAPDYLLKLVARSKTLKEPDENRRSFVVWAARYGHTEAAREALGRNTPAELGIDEHVEGTYSPLELACMCRRREICRMLVMTWDPAVPAPDSTRAGDFVGICLFERFIEYDWEDVTKALIQRFCPLDVKSQIVVDALEACVEKGWLGCVEALLRRGVSPNSFSSSGHSPLLVAAKLNQIDTVGCLLQNRATGLEPAAMIAIHMNHLDCLQVVFDAVAHTPDFIRTTACIAALENNCKALKLILADHTANKHIHVLGPKLSTMVERWIPLRNLNRLEPSLYQAVVSDNLAVPLLCAVAKGSLSCTTFLLEMGADPLAMDENGLTAIVWACAVGNLEIVKVLLKHGANFSEQNIMPFSEMKVIYNITVIEKIEGRMKKLLRRTLQTNAGVDKVQISVQPLMVALMRGHTDVVRLLIEVGASTTEVLEWCNQTLLDEPKMEPFLRSMLEQVVLYEDYKAYGPFGIQGHAINRVDAGKIPDDGSLHSVVTQFSPSDWSLIAIQFVHRVRGELVQCAIHSTTRPSAGRFHKLHPYAHVERLDLEEHEFIIHAEVAVGESSIHALRFSTNLRVTQWLGGNPLVPNHRIVTVAPVGREIVGLFTSVSDKFYLVGFLTRLRIGDFPWRTFRQRIKPPAPAKPPTPDPPPAPKEAEPISF